MNNILAIHKFAVDGDYAEKIYEIFKESHFVVNQWQPFKDSVIYVEFNYADGVFRVEERTACQLSYIAEILYFFADRNNIYSLSEYLDNGVVRSYDVDDCEGKYFVRPPKTEWELQQEEVQRLRREQSDDDLPF